MPVSSRTTSKRKSNTPSVKTLPKNATDALRGHLEIQYDSDADSQEHDHHHEQEPLLATAIAAAVINFLLMFGLCCAYGMIMFTDDHNKQHRALGVKMNLATAMILGVSLSRLSGVQVAIGGPDLNPVVFIGMFVDVMSVSIASQLGMEREYKQDGFCIGDHLAANVDNCEQYHNELRATTIFAVVMSTSMLGIIFFCLGFFELTRYVSYVPSSIMEAFLSCVGYKVFKYGLHFCHYEPAQFIPAACVGVTLYFMKAKHVGNPAVVMPLGIFVPLGLFYACVFAFDFPLSFADLEDAEKRTKMMFPIMDNCMFYRIWADSIGKVGDINIKAWMATFTDAASMLIVCVLDCALKIASTESKLPVKVQKDYEISLYGLSNFFTSMSGASVGYMQLKFNVINYGVMRNVTDRRAGTIYAVLCGCFFFGNIEIFNVVPRFFIGLLLFFAGAGFVAENLWGSRKYLSFHEWLEILTILAIFIFTGRMDIAVVAGGFLVGISFIRKYAKVPAIAGRPLTGSEVSSRERRTLLMQRNIQHIANSWLTVIRLKGFIFFGSAQSLTGFVKNRMDAERKEGVPSFRRLKFVIFDCELLDGLDASAARSVRALVKEAKAHHVRIMWSHVTPKFVSELVTREILTSDARDWFSRLDDAVLYVEEIVKDYRCKLQDRWHHLHPTFLRNTRFVCNQTRFEPFRNVFVNDRTRIGLPWAFCTKIKVEAYKTLLFERGDQRRNLYLIHSGAIGLFTRLPGGDEEWDPPVAVYRHGWFLNREALVHAVSKFYAVALEDGEVICWSEGARRRMVRARPNMMMAVMKAAMKQDLFDDEKRETATDRRGQPVLEQEWEEFGQVKSFNAQKERLVAHANFFGRNAAARGGSEGSTETSSASVRDFLKEAKTLNKFLDASMPEELQTHLSGMIAAQALSHISFYQSSSDSMMEAKLPRMPDCIKDDINTAFNTYSVVERMQDIIYAEDVPYALMYAGIFCPYLLEDDQGQRQELPPTLKRKEFEDLAHEGLMLRLTSYQRQMLEQLFVSFDFDEDEYLDGDELFAACKELLHSNINADEVDSIAAAWTGNVHGNNDIAIDKESFMGIISSFARRHKQDYELLTACREVLRAGRQLDGEYDEKRFPGDQRLSVDSLMAFHRRGGGDGLTAEEAEELLWVADWRLDDDSDGKSIDFGSFIAAVLLHIDESRGTLPPPPKFSSPPEPNAQAKPSLLGDKLGTAQAMRITASKKSSKSSTYVDDAVYCTSLDDCILPPQMLVEPSELPIPPNPPKMAFECLEVVPAANIAGDVSETFVKEVSHSNSNESIDSDNSQTIDHQDVPDTFRARFHLLLEDPRSSAKAAVVSNYISIMIILNVLVVFLQPLIMEKNPEDRTDIENQVWTFVDMYFTVLFTLEVAARIAVADALGTRTALEFLRQPSTICDIGAVIPSYVELVFDNKTLGSFFLLKIVRLAKLMKLVRVARLGQKIPLAAPISVVLVVIWGIYLKKNLSE